MQEKALILYFALLQEHHVLSRFSVVPRLQDRPSEVGGVISRDFGLVKVFGLYGVIPMVAGASGGLVFEEGLSVAFLEGGFRGNVDGPGEFAVVLVGIVVILMEVLHEPLKFSID